MLSLCKNFQLSMKQLALILSVLLALPAQACIKQHAFQNKAKHSGSQLFRTFPKGADLHTHLDGAVYAEKLIAAGEYDHFCLDKKNYVALSEKSCVNKVKLSELPKYPRLYKQTIEQWSMQDFTSADLKQSGHDHFFDAFGKFITLSWAHRTDTMTDVLTRAAQNNVSYLEIMDTIDNNASGILGSSILYTPDFDKMAKQLQQLKILNLVEHTSRSINKLKADLNSSFHCELPLLRNRACGVRYKFLYQVMREQEPNQIFASLLLGFELAHQHPDVVGLNLVQPEDGKLALRDYHLHMQMIRYFHKRYPDVNVSLHAGELIPGLVADHDLTFHIGEAITIAGAKRIGHGVAIKHEKDLGELLKTMREQGILVEINLSSNDAILGIKGKAHPIHYYLQHQVPVAISTDDEGLLRTTISKEYQRAFEQNELDYCTLKQMSRNSLTYSFLPGESLWQLPAPTAINPKCSVENILNKPPSKRCLKLLQSSEKARAQWELERKFARYERSLL